MIRQDVVFLEGATTVQTDALICSTGWRFEPSVEFRPKEIHADLRIPRANLTSTQKRAWNRLNIRADLEIFERFPKLMSGPKID